MYYTTHTFMSPPRRPRPRLAAGDYYGRFRGGTTRPGMRYAMGDVTITPQIGGGLGEWLGGLIGLPTGLGGAIGSTFLPEVTGGSGGAQDSPYIPNIIEAPLEAALNVGAPGVRKRRTMNAANIGALRRALRRVDSFRNLAKKSGAIPAAKRLPAQRNARCCK